MKKNIDKEIEKLINPSVVLRIDGLSKSNPEYDLYFFSTLLLCIWESLYNKDLNPSYHIKDSVGNIYFNEELRIKINNGVNTIVKTAKGLRLENKPKPFFMSIYDYLYIEDSNSNKLYCYSKELMGTSLFNSSMFSVELKKPIDELTQEDYYSFLGKNFKENNGRLINGKEEKVFLTLHSYNQKKSVWKTRLLTF
ncbi:hypothetical protein [Tenacibaculum singaporense]|uniref:hypothetical protein n=1 Tax=Tenacibaculum singaporense TaxID=2358479 RepID=UPI003511C850